MNRAWPIIVLGALALVISVSVVAIAIQRAPIQHGNAAGFWYAACRVKLDGWKTRQGTKVYLSRDEWMLYGRSHFHGEDLFKVPLGDAFDAFPLVCEAIDEPREHGPQYIEAGIAVWKKTNPRHDDPQGLLDAIAEARETTLLNECGPEQVECSRALVCLADTRSRDDWKWWCLAIPFEILLLCTLLLLAAWPWLLSDAPKWRWSLHLSLLPLVFFGPYLLGYASMTFTSAFPEGGILYPHLLRFFDCLPWMPLDPWLVQRLPRPLADLTPLPGPMMSISFMGRVGPVSVLTMAVLLGTLPFLPVCWRRLRRHASPKPPISGDTAASHP